MLLDGFSPQIHPKSGGSEEIFRISALCFADTARVAPSMNVSKTLLCFTVAGTQPKAPFEAGLTVNQLVNQSMFQNETGATDSETMAAL